ncbi:MAG: hypothetical protein JST38_02080 [Bacteroidetes bacterium]|nr:hypothetical protein [Bacteroidota bacterium]
MPGMVKFHNARNIVYRTGVMPTASHSVLARLRSSARLAVLVLLVFALRIGSVSACAQQDFADLGFGGNPHGVMVKAPTDLDVGGKTTVSHGGSCADCGCHHPATLPPMISTAHVQMPQVLRVVISGIPPSTAIRQELRPPIA